MKPNDVWAFVAEAETTKTGQKRLYFVNTEGEVKVERIGKCGSTFKIYTFDRTFRKKFDKKCNKMRYGKYHYCAAGSVHRFVAFAFLPKPEISDYEVDHINGNPSDNRLENLRWVSHQ